MSTSALLPNKPEMVYPESDGLPLSDNTRQFRWIMTIQGGLDAQYLDDANVFVAGNLLWYPVQNNNKIRCAPDVFVAIGRPKGDRGSYLQWLEGDVAPQTVFEIVSPSNSAGVLTEKFRFYERYRVEEYYLYDPQENLLDGWIREKKLLSKIERMDGWVSPLLGIRFDMSGDELRVFGRDGQEFVATPEAVRQRDIERRAKEKALQEKEQERQRAEKLAAQLKSLGVEPQA